MWIVFLLFCLFGVLMLFSKRTLNIKSFIIIKIIGVSFLVFGIVGMIGMVVGNEKMCISGTFVPIAITIMGESLIVRVKKKVCNVCVEAKCTNYRACPGGKGQTTMLQFLHTLMKVWNMNHSPHCLIVKRK